MAQGIAHVAPLSGGAHLYLFETFTSWTPLEPSIQLAMSFGWLLALMAYLRRDLADMGTGIIRAAKGKRDPGARLAAQLAIGAILAGGAAFALMRYVDLTFDTARAVGWAALICGGLLFLLDRMSMTIKRIEHASFADTVIVALAQLIAVIPGVGRSSITMIFGRVLGYERMDAARLSMLLGIPALAAFCALRTLEMWRDGTGAWSASLLVAGVLSFLAALLTLAAMMAWLRRHTFAPFAVYRIILGAVILALISRG